MSNIQVYGNFFEMRWGVLPSDYSSLELDDMYQEIFEDVFGMSDTRINKIISQNSFAGSSETLKIKSDGVELSKDIEIKKFKKYWEPQKSTDSILVERRYSFGKVKLFEFEMTQKDFVDNAEFFKTELELDEFEFANITSLKISNEMPVAYRYNIDDSSNSGSSGFSRIVHTQFDGEWEEIDIVEFP